MTMIRFSLADLPPGFCESDLPEPMTTEEALARLHAVAGMLYRPGLPELTDEELRDEARKAWVRAAADRDLRTMS